MLDVSSYTTSNDCICLLIYDATGIVTAARKYRAGRAVVLFTVRPVPSTRQIKKYIEEVMKMF
jgi:hypothetical protein